MSLDLYREVSTGVYVAHSRDGEDDGLLPITSTHDGVLGEVVEVKLFIRNDDITEWYSNITVRSICNTSPDETDGITTGHGIKLYPEGDPPEQPTEAEWEATDYSNTADISNIGSAGNGDVSTYSPFWYRSEVPAGTPADNRENIVLRLNYVANVV